DVMERAAVHDDGIRDRVVARRAQDRVALQVDADTVVDTLVRDVERGENEGQPRWGEADAHRAGRAGRQRLAGTGVGGDRVLIRIAEHEAHAGDRDVRVARGGVRRRLGGARGSDRLV